MNFHARAAIPRRQRLDRRGFLNRTFRALIQFRPPGRTFHIDLDDHPIGPDGETYLRGNTFFAVRLPLGRIPVICESPHESVCIASIIESLFKNNRIFYAGPRSWNGSLGGKRPRLPLRLSHFTESSELNCRTRSRRGSLFYGSLGLFGPWLSRNRRRSRFGRIEQLFQPFPNPRDGLSIRIILGRWLRFRRRWWGGRRWRWRHKFRRLLTRFFGGSQINLLNGKRGRHPNRDSPFRPDSNRQQYNQMGDQRDNKRLTHDYCFFSTSSPYLSIPASIIALLTSAAL